MKRLLSFLGVWSVFLGGAELLESSAGPARLVVIKNFEFTPRTVTLVAGVTVRWTNADVANHQITTGGVEGGRPMPDGRVSSPLLFREDEFTATFQAPGEYPYYCGVHPFMRGAIVVK